MRLFLLIMLCIFSRCFAQPAIELPNIIIDVGEICEGPEYELVWYFKNTGNQPLAITRVKNSGSILAGYYSGELICPGFEGKINAKLFTKGWSNNAFNKSFLVSTNAGNVLLTAKGFIRQRDSISKNFYKTTFSNAALNADIYDVGHDAIILSGKAYYNIQPGDILFQDLDCGAACDAIESVTEGANGMDFSHCGLVVQQGNDMVVVEAYGAVKATPVDSFFARSTDANGKPKVLIGRVKEQYMQVADESAELAKQYIGKAYDNSFDIKNDSYYCSELLFEVFKTANNNKPFFPLNKMTFNLPGSKQPMPFWVDYFSKLKVPIPEGQPGINPGAMSRSDKLELIKPERL